MRYINYVWVFAAALFHHIAYSQSLSAQIDELIEKQLPRATVGVLIKDAQTGEVIYSRNANKLLTPASSTKLFTAAAAMYYLKPDFHFLTRLSQKEKNYYLQFSGSPSLTVSNLTDLLGHFKKKNISKIEGNLVIDNTHYPAPYYLNGDSYDDLGWAYTVPDTAAVLNENAETYELISSKELGMPAQLRRKSNVKSPKQGIAPPKALTIINEVLTVSKEEEKNHCSLNVEIKENNTLRLFGCIVQDKNPKRLELAIPDPLLFVKQVTRKALAQNHIKLTGQIISGSTPSDAQVLASYQSDDLVPLLKHMLQKSDNLYANSITRKLGFLVTGKATHKEGIFAIKKIIAEHTLMDMKEMELSDGEGTRYNLIAAEQLVALLSHLYKDQEKRSVLLKTLPQAGVSGTLQARMKNTLLDKKVFAKTGSMHDVSSLSGFIINPDSKSFVFSIITNGLIKSNAKAKILEEKILLVVAQHYLEQNTTSPIN